MRYRDSTRDFWRKSVSTLYIPLTFCGGDGISSFLGLSIDASDRELSFAGITPPVIWEMIDMIWCFRGHENRDNMYIDIFARGGQDGHADTQRNSDNVDYNLGNIIAGSQRLFSIFNLLPEYEHDESMRIHFHYNHTALHTTDLSVLSLVAVYKQ